MRIAIAGVLGGIVLFFWGFLAHSVIPLGNVGMPAPTDEDSVLAAMREGLPREGVYFLPYIDEAKMQDEAASAAWAEKSLAQPYALVVYQPQGRDNREMGGMLGLQFASDTAIGFALAWLLALLSGGRGQRIAVATGVGVVGWLGISLPYMNWYRFPLDFTLANLAEQTIGFALAGAAVAWWLGRSESR